MAIRKSVISLYYLSKMKVQLLIDNPNSWMIPYAEQLCEQIICEYGECQLIGSHEQIQQGDVLCLLSCEKILKDLSKNHYNLVVHGSALPQGRGWSPLTWQVLEGKNEIPMTLFEATSAVDAGRIYLQSTIRLDGTELNHEMRDKQGIAIIDLIMKFLQSLPAPVSIEQQGEASYYKRRSPEDSRLDVSKSIADQFNLLRVVDNDRYPAFFTYKGSRYTLKIEKV